MSDQPGQRLGKTTDDLAALEAKISAARGAQKPEPRKDAEKYRAMSMAWRITIELVVSIMVGAAMGWGLDSLFGSLPMFLIVFCMLGLVAGVRTIMRTANEMQRNQVERSAGED